MNVTSLVQSLSRILLDRGWKLATAESCTGGHLAHILTSYPGGSRFFEAGIVTYSINSKSQVLGIPLEVIDSYGVVSSTVVEQMAKQALRLFDVDVALATTGWASPRDENDEMREIWIGGAIRSLTSSEDIAFSSKLEVSGYDRLSAIEYASIESLILIQEKLLSLEI